MTAVLAAIAAAPPAAAGAAAWSEPQEISSRPGLASDVALTYSSDGHPFVTWGQRTGSFAHSPGSLIDSVFAFRGNGGWSRGDLPNAVLPPLVSADTRGGFLLAGTEYLPDDNGGSQPEQVRAWTARASAPAVGGGRLIWKGKVMAFDGAATADGGAAIAWLGQRGTGDHFVGGVYASTRRPGGRFTRPQRLSREAPSRDRILRIAAAIDPRKGAAFAWRERNSMYVRAGHPGGRAGTRIKIGSAGGTGDVVGLAIGPRGDMTALWTRVRDKQTAIVTAYSADGRHFGRTRVLDTCRGEFDCWSVPSAQGRDGELVGAWANRDGAEPVIRAVTLRRGTGDVRQIDRGTMPQNARVDVAADSLGNAAVSWPPSGFDHSRSGFTIALRPSGGEFGTPEFVPTPEDSYPGPAIAFDPVTGTPSAAYATQEVSVDYAPVWFTERR